MTKLKVTIKVISDGKATSYESDYIKIEEGITLQGAAKYSVQSLLAQLPNAKLIRKSSHD
jgi:hypothetical protein